MENERARTEEAGKPRVIFFGNGKLASVVYETLKDKIQLVFWAKTKEDLVEVERIKREEQGLGLESGAGERTKLEWRGEQKLEQGGGQKLERREEKQESKLERRKIYGVLASYGVMVPERILKLFEPEGILNIHPSRLPDLRGPSPIETAILRGDTEFFVSVMKLVREMDAGPIYYQGKMPSNKFVQKEEVYTELGRMGAEWVGEHLVGAASRGEAGAVLRGEMKVTSQGGTKEVLRGEAALRNEGRLPKPVPQEETGVTYSQKLDTKMAWLRPNEQTAEEMSNQVRAFEGFPKTRTEILGRDCIILRAHVAEKAKLIRGRAELNIQGKDGRFLVVDELQPAGKKVMGAEAFLNGYAKKTTGVETA